ncbi:MAG TPA: hypothetical protein VLV86_17120 [Vicinamibacterales bacterium]|nr:hypothetical protein [Vicinamibacterales bacterium]
MRLICAAVALVVSMTGSDIERALAIARARDTERQQFHSRYVFAVNDPAVTQIEVITDFRRLVTIAEDHVLRGDSMFTRGVRAAEQALAPTRGTVTIRAQVRLNPLNTFIDTPDYGLGIGNPSGAFTPVNAQLTPQYSVPFKTRQGKTVTSLIGATLESNLPSEGIGQTTRAVFVTLDGKEVTRLTVDFGRLD